LRIGNFEHKPSLLVTLLFILFAAALLSLGTWQMMRAAQKTNILAAADLARASKALKLDELDDVLDAARQHSRVTFSGTYEPSRQFLWDNRVHKGQAGFEVITPVSTESGLVLVNRGWVPLGSTREDLPSVAITSAVQDKSVTITGLFSRPSKGLVNGAAFDDNASWPRVMQYFDYTAMEMALGKALLAGVVQPQQAGGAKSKDAQEALSEHPEFYTANWEPTAAIGPIRHYGYAFQWYAMALALTILFIVHNTKRIEPDQ